MKFRTKPTIFRWITNSAGFPYGITKTQLSSRRLMKERLIHQWKDWLLKYVGDDTYELIKKENLSTQKIKAKNDIDAENQSQLIIKNAEVSCTCSSYKPIIQE